MWSVENISKNHRNQLGRTICIYLNLRGAEGAGGQPILDQRDSRDPTTPTTITTPKTHDFFNKRTTITTTTPLEKTEFQM